MSDNKQLELTQTEANILLGFLNYAVSQGLPQQTAIQDAHNAVALFNKIAGLFPPEVEEDVESESENKEG